MLTNSAYIQGDIGEAITASELRSKCGMLVLRNLYLDYNNSICEIDIIALSKLGVFVIENKNYKAKVSGSIQEYFWSLNYPSLRSEKLFNPIKQNTKHISILRSILIDAGFLDLPLYNIVIFNDYKCSLNLSGCEDKVFLLSDFIDKYNKLDIDNLSDDYIYKLYDFLKSYSDQSLNARLDFLEVLRGDL